MLKRCFYILISFLFIYSCASDIPLATNGNISGTVSEQGSSNTISGVNIALSGESTQSKISDSSGTFSFNNIPVGNYVRSPGGIFVTESGDIYIGDEGIPKVIKKSSNDSSWSLIAERNTSNYGGNLNYIDGVKSVFIDESGHIYIADPGRKKVFKSIHVVD